VLIAVIGLGSLYLLVRELADPAPLTKGSLALILLYSFDLVLVVIAVAMITILDLFRGLIDSQKEFVSLVSEGLDPKTEDLKDDDGRR
jgi:hypothetical protein